MTVVSLDFETASEADIKVVGLSRYARDPSTRVLMCAYRLNGVQGFWDVSSGRPFPVVVIEALADPAAEKWAFNAAFERMITKHVLGIDTPYEGWRCTMALAYTQSFVGGLGEVSEQMGMPLDLQKASYGKKLIKMFSMPQKVTAKQPLRWFDHTTHPREWAEFCAYCVQDEVTEDAMRQRLQRYPLAEREWELYELDQRINDEGLPIDRRFVVNAIKMSDRRKAELSVQMKRLTGLDNPNSTEQLLAWLKPRGYPFDDLQKDTVSKVLSETKGLAPEAAKVMRLRQQSARAAVKKYDAIMARMDDDDRVRHTFQFAGASRTLRWAGRGFQPQNLVRTPKSLEKDGWLETVTEAIRDGNMDLVSLIVGEPMDALAGCVRSAIRAPEGYELVACDLASIESRVVGWVSECARLMKVFADGLDPYKDFGTELYGVPYDAVTKLQRTNSKPAVLGCSYGLGGGDLVEGKKTGLWGYAAGMGIDLTREEAKASVAKFRDTYAEIPQLWYSLDHAAKTCVQTGKTAKVNRFLTFERRAPYLMLRLPAPDRYIYYFQPKLGTFWFAKHPVRGTIKPLGQDAARAENAKAKGWEVYSKTNLIYSGKPQNKPGWVRLPTRGAKLVENLTQAIARDVIKECLLRAYDAGFNTTLHAHDEVVAIARIGSKTHSPERLREIMSQPIDWAPGLLLDAGAFRSEFYRKD